MRASGSLITSDFFGMGCVYPAESTPILVNHGVRVIADTFQTNPMSGVPGTQWGAIELTEGTYNWSWFDTVVNQCLIANKKISLLLFGSEEPYGQATIPTWALTNPADFLSIPITAKAVTWTQDVVGRALKLGVSPSNLQIRIWNEPDDSGGSYSGTVAQMVTLCAAIYPAIKAISPAITVISPDTTGNINTSVMWMDSFLATGWNYIDVVGCHAYQNATFTEQIVNYLQNIKSCMVRNSAGRTYKPIWNTECGFGNQSSMANDSDRASYVIKAHVLTYGNNIDQFGWYVYDGPDGPRVGYQYNGRLLQIGSTTVLRAPGIAYNQIYNWMVGAKFQSLNNDNNSWIYAPGGVYTPGVVYWADLTRSGGYQARIIWTSDRSTPAYSTPSWATRYRDAAGNITTGLGPTVTLGYSPIILESGAPP